MRSFIALVGALLVLACSAVPALAMPAYDSPSEAATRPQVVREPVTAVPAADAAGTGAAVVVLVGGVALLAGAGVGFGAGRAPWRGRRVAAS
jgi:hypothetical protein